MTQFDPNLAANLSGLQYRTNDTLALKAIASGHKGPTAPTYAQAGYFWINDSADPIWTLSIYDGSTWILLGTINTTTDIFFPEPVRSCVEPITQSAHGLTVNNVIRRTAISTYVKAQADAIANCAGLAGIVIQSSTNTFKFCDGGMVTGLTGLTDGTLYYLSEATPGLLTATKPEAPNLVVPVLLATGATTGVLLLGGYRNPDWIRYGAGSPEGVVTAVPGVVFLRTDGSSGTIVYVKETGTGNTGWVAYASGGRTKLIAARTYYVRTDGNNSNDGLTNSAGGAFLTIQKAVDVASALDLNGNNITIQIGNGTYVENVQLKSFVGQGRITVKGDTTTPANVFLNAGGGGVNSSGFYFDGFGIYSISGIKIAAVNCGLYATNGATLFYDACEFGTAGFVQIYSEDSALIKCEGNYRVVGGAQYHARAIGGQVVIGNKTVNFTSASIAYSFTMGAERCGSVQIQLATFSNATSVTGGRYSAQMCGVISTQGQGANFIPGNSAGITGSNGVYN